MLSAIWAVLAMQGIDHAVKGLNSGTLQATLPLIIGVLIVVVVKCSFIAVSSHLPWYLAGALALWFTNSYLPPFLRWSDSKSPLSKC